MRREGKSARLCENSGGKNILEKRRMDAEKSRGITRNITRAQKRETARRQIQNGRSYRNNDVF